MVTIICGWFRYEYCVCWLVGGCMMNKYEVMIQFRGEPLFTSYVNAKNARGAKFAVILEASMNGFNVSEIVQYLITQK
jgi:hypothetical protein